MLPFASAHNVRLVLLNARDNGQSTLFTEAELSAIHSSDISIQRQFLRDTVCEYASFLKWYIYREDIPPIREDPVTGERMGGINLIAWSGGNAYFIPFFGMADVIPERVRDAIEPYLRSYVIFGGYSTPQFDPKHTGVEESPVRCAVLYYRYAGPSSGQDLLPSA